jgi:hypothetical protein
MIYALLFLIAALAGLCYTQSRALKLLTAMKNDQINGEKQCAEMFEKYLEHGSVRIEISNGAAKQFAGNIAQAGYPDLSCLYRMLSGIKYLDHVNIEIHRT